MYRTQSLYEKSLPRENSKLSPESAVVAVSTFNPPTLSLPRKGGGDVLLEKFASIVILLDIVSFRIGSQPDGYRLPPR